MNNKPKIKLLLEGKNLQAFYAISGFFECCGKAGRVGLIPNSSLKQQFKFNDTDFLCLYKGLISAINSERYPNKKSSEYTSLLEIKAYLENEYMVQRGCNLSME